MATTPARLSLPVLVADAEIGRVDIDLAVESRHANQSVVINTSGNVDGAIAKTLVEIAERLAPGITAPISGIDQPAPVLEWPTTPGSAVLADRYCGAGPQVLILAKTERDNSSASQEHRWWGGHDDKAAYPIAGAWSHNRPTSGYDLLQILHVAP